MAAPSKDKPSSKPKRPVTGAHQPYVPDDVQMREFTWQAVAVGAILGIVFAASSLYLVLKVGLTVSASIPIAVLSITLFRLFSRVFGVRKTTILENNIVQTTGSAGESIAFGVGVTMPALMLLGFDMEITRVMTVGVLGGLLGILMMIPLRRAFIVKQSAELPYPEGTACAEVLIAGEKGGASAKTVFAGFGLAFLYNFLMRSMKLWSGEANQPLYSASGQGLKGGVLGAEITPELLGVGYIIGPQDRRVYVCRRRAGLSGARAGHRSVWGRCRHAGLSGEVVG
jgi:putative OPT family oligopeptide transporter